MLGCFLKLVCLQGFENKKLNCWASSLLQMLFSSNLPELLVQSEVTLAKKLLPIPSSDRLSPINPNKETDCQSVHFFH